MCVCVCVCVCVCPVLPCRTNAINPGLPLLGANSRGLEPHSLPLPRPGRSWLCCHALLSGWRTSTHEYLQYSVQIKLQEPEPELTQQQFDVIPIEKDKPEGSQEALDATLITRYEGHVLSYHS